MRGALVFSTQIESRGFAKPEASLRIMNRRQMKAYESRACFTQGVRRDKSARGSRAEKRINPNESNKIQKHKHSGYMLCIKTGPVLISQYAAVKPMSLNEAHVYRFACFRLKARAPCPRKLPLSRQYSSKVVCMYVQNRSFVICELSPTRASLS
ncbi:hypothetical protein BO86DRAFT_204706 [Aspergillus japonicus CBS 114.51]|uniref:Uncharacterized protein n=1 Tax=Aspergillus japonicus CBS 114.51 TaxID=1448312 RepID=A0A8T8WR57_ASPJA|nr:hypothetical protein BO86DRAFT_204706 [Aspergillus japonicus CBS 114.51]RAH77819.1 hypothetical protein BO86DRAFT_204706 [Aspergillus japonicus CBS 114.51]